MSKGGQGSSLLPWKDTVVHLRSRKWDLSKHQTASSLTLGSSGSETVKSISVCEPHSLCDFVLRAKLNSEEALPECPAEGPQPEAHRAQEQNRLELITNGQHGKLSQMAE